MNTHRDRSVLALQSRNIGNGHGILPLGMGAYKRKRAPKSSETIGRIAL
jgi:hypothetical protein